MELAAKHLLDFGIPFDVSLLDQIVAIAMDGAHPQRTKANEFLVLIKDHPGDEEAAPASGLTCRRHVEAGRRHPRERGG